jgi:hypothetical protein
MSGDLFFQGIALEFKKFIFHGDDILYFKPGCMDCSGADVHLMLDHKESLRSTRDRLDFYAGEDALAFRLRIPGGYDSTALKFSELADEFDSYLPVSLGCTRTETETMTIDGVNAKIVCKATLNEVSVLSTAPAMQASYGRIVSTEICGSLQEDYESGRLQLIGRYITIHRKMMASENGGEIRYSHVTSDYERKASAFERALAKLQ